VVAAAKETLGITPKASAISISPVALGPKPKPLTAFEEFSRPVPRSTGYDPVSPEEMKVAARSSFTDSAPAPVKTLTPSLKALFQGGSLTPPPPRLRIEPPQQQDLDQPEMARSYLQGIEAQKPKLLVDKLKEGYRAYSDFIKNDVGRKAEQAALGLLGFGETFLGSVEWLASRSDSSISNDIEAKAKASADRVGEWITKASTEMGDPSFGDKIAQGFGSSAAFFVPGLGVARGATALARVSPKIALYFGNSASASLEAMSEAGNVFRASLAEGKSDIEASEAATKTFWANAILVSLTNRFGVFNSDVAGYIKRMVYSAPIEGIQEAAQQMISNVTQEREDILEGTGESFLIGAIVGSAMGAGVEALGPKAQGGPQNILPTEEPPAPTSSEAAQAAPGKEIALETAEVPAATATEQPAAKEEGGQTEGRISFDNAYGEEMEKKELKKAGFGEEAMGFGESATVLSIDGKPAVAFSFMDEGLGGFSVAKDFRNKGIATKFLKQMVEDYGGTLNVVDANDAMLAVLKKVGTVSEPDGRGVVTVTTAAQAGQPDTLILTPENLDQEIDLRTEEILRDQYEGKEGFRAMAKKDAREDVRENVELETGKEARPEQLITKTSLRQMVDSLGPIDLTVEIQDGVKYLTFEGAENGRDISLRLKPSALGLVDTNLVEDQTIRLDPEELKKKGTAIRGVSSRTGGALAFNIKNFDAGVFSKKGIAETDKIVARSEIARQLSEKLGVPVRTGRFGGGALGIFKPWAHTVRLKSKLGDLRIPVLVHESAHFIDYTLFGQPKKGKAANDPKNWTTTKFVSDLIPRAELDPLLTEYGGTPGTYPKKREAFAEFIRYWVTEPFKTEQRAPKFLKIWEEEILPQYPEVRDVYLTTRADFERWNSIPAAAKVLSQISFGERKKGWQERKQAFVEGWHDLLSKWTEDLYPIKQFSDLAKKRGVKLDLEDDPYILARLTRGWVGKAATFLEKGTFDPKFWTMEDGKAVPVFKGKGFAEIIAPVVSQNATEDLSVYLVSRRALDLNERGIHSGVSTENAKEAFEAMRKKHPEFEKVTEELDTYQDHILDYLYKSGLMTPETYEKLRVEMRNYVPFYRVMEAVEEKGLGGKTLADLRSPVKRIKGSDRDIINPLESIVKNTYAMINAAERNRVGIAMMNLSTRHPELAQLFEKIPTAQTKVAGVKINDLIDQVSKGMLPEGEEAKDMLGDLGEEIVDIFRPSMIQDKNVLTVMIKGKPQSFHVDPDIYKAMQGADAEDITFIHKLLSYPSRWLRAGATLTPEFMVRNPARDMMTAYIYSEHGFMPPIDMARGLYGAFTKDKDYWLWRMGGGEQAALTSMDRTTLKKTYEELAEAHDITPKNMLKRGLKGVINPVEGLRIFSEFSEKMTRIGEAKKAISRGKNPLEAAFAAREITLDFSKIGSKARAMNMIIAFFNAGIQANVRTVRAFKERPLQTTTKALLGITLPSVMLLLWNMQEPDWEEIPDWQKNLSWLIKLPGGTSPDLLTAEEGDGFFERLLSPLVKTTDGVWLRFPKPFELGTLFGSLPERVMEAIKYNDPGALAEIGKTIVDGLVPPLMPTALLPLLENATNHSFFQDRALVPDSIEALPEFAQYTTYTSETAKTVGKWLGYSPIKVDNLINGYFAGLGRYAVQAIDKATAAIAGKEAPPPPPEGTAADVALVKAFVVREPIGSASESVNRFYVESEEANKAKNYHDNLIAAGDLKAAEEWRADHPEIYLAPFYTGVRENLATMRRLQTMIRDSEKLTPAQKRDQIDELSRAMTDLAYKAIHMTLKEE
jgi:hypothetical protein